ncbi:MAG: hypothetical protein KC503_20310 [Myxococcales bacterium]|nr:hypothetical protein [Myxococcales bacterium]
MRRSILAALLAVAFTLATTRHARAETDPQIVAGITLAAVGGAGALVSDFGSLIYIADLEYARGWGWLSLLSGLTTGAGGIILARVEPKARVIGPLTIAFSALTIIIGIVGVSLPRRTSKWHSLSLTMAPVMTPDGGQGAALTVGGRF